MKQTPEEKKQRHQFEAGVLSKSGFLGTDQRHIHDIVADDEKMMSAFGCSSDDLADLLQQLLDAGKKGLEDPVEVSGVTVSLQWDRGMGPCPFGHPGLYPKMLVQVSDTKGRQFSYTQLSVHLVRRHGFLGGEGSPFRIPVNLILEMGLLKPA